MFLIKKFRSSELIWNSSFNFKNVIWHFAEFLPKLKLNVIKVSKNIWNTTWNVLFKFNINFSFCVSQYLHSLPNNKNKRNEKFWNWKNSKKNLINYEQNLNVIKWPWMLRKSIKYDWRCLLLWLILISILNVYLFISPDFISISMSLLPKHSFYFTITASLPNFSIFFITTFSITKQH